MQVKYVIIKKLLIMHICDHKTSHTGHFFFNWELYISWINKRSTDLWFVRIGQYLAEIHLNIWILRVQKKNLNFLKNRL